MNVQRLVRMFFVSVGIILFASGFIKFITTFSDARIFLISDPLFGMTYRDLLRYVGIAEIGIGIICVFGKRTRLRAWLVAWFATNLVLYRIGLVFMDYHKPCSCLGNLTDMMRISPEVADTSMKIILGYLLIGSYASLLLFWQQKRNTLPSVPAAFN